MAEALRLFLVEDDDDIALLIRKSLERADYHVTSCRTAAGALTVLGHAHSTFDLVLLDQRLPDMSGLDLLQTLNREGITTPVLMVTGHGGEHLAAQVLRAGALDYVVKDPALGFLTELPKRVSESLTRHRLQHHNRLLSAALESARDGILITDLEGTLVHVNKALEQLTGYTRQELIGQKLHHFQSALDPQGDYIRKSQTIQGRSSWPAELVNRRKDGSLFETSLTVSPIVDGRGALTHFVAIYRDISDRKLLERQLVQAQKMQSVGTLAGGVAHEFNNLLAGIQGYAALGEREPDLSPTLKEFLGYIVQLTDRAANLTRQLLAFARKPALSRQPTRMDKLLLATADLVRNTLRLEVEVDLPPACPSPAPPLTGEGRGVGYRDGSGGEPLLALADANQLQQVLVNLTLNARDAVALRPGSLSAAAEAKAAPVVFRLRHALLSAEQPAFPGNVPPGDYVVLEVQDHGQGMTPEVLGQALDPFFTTKEIGQGTGLGLPVALGIVHGHQGHLTIDTAPGQGTTVGLYLRRLTEVMGAQHVPGFEAGLVLEPESVTPRSILVVDDEEAVLDVIRRYLEKAGHQVLCATSGKQGVALLAEGRHVDLVILDLMIPHEEAGHTFRSLREQRPDLPVLLCTGLVQAGPGLPLLEEPSVGLLRKPFKMNELWYAVDQELADRPDSGGRP
ncbi:MAG: response regulator [Gemmataceae bacterium]|nr:response regulator [Gemmataceae bacterium]